MNVDQDNQLLDRTRAVIGSNTLPPYFDQNLTAQILSVIDACHRVTSVDDFKYVVRKKVRPLIPHELSVCGVGERGQLRIDNLINIDFPDAYLEKVIARTTAGTLLKSPVAKDWAKQPEIKIINNLEVFGDSNEEWVKAVRKYNIQNMVVDGVIDIAGKKTSYMCFARFSEKITNRHSVLMKYITPHLHIALTKVFYADFSYINAQVDLTDREVEILNLLYCGCTNNNIAGQLGISSNTVKNHVHSILTKLKAVNRSQAIVIAIALGLINETLSV